MGNLPHCPLILAEKASQTSWLSSLVPAAWLRRPRRTIYLSSHAATPQPPVDHLESTYSGLMSIPLIDDILFAENENLPIIISAFGTGIALIFQFSIGILAYTEKRRSKSDIPNVFMALFIFSFTLAFLCTSGRVAASAIYLHYGSSHSALSFITSITNFCYGSFLFILLLTLVVRLYIAFQGSALEMTTNQVHTFIFLFVLSFILMILACVGYTLYFYGENEIGWILYLSGGASAVFLYVVGCALAVRQFVMNLSQLAKFTMSSQTNLSAEDVALNSKQQKLLHLSAKYVLLFFVAILSTLLTAFLFFVVSHYLAGLFTCIDLCANLLVLYLQFAFAAKQYQTCCGCLDSRCRAVVVKRTKRELQKESSDVITCIGQEIVKPV